MIVKFSCLTVNYEILTIKVEIELNLVSWSKFEKFTGFTVFSKEVQFEAVIMYLQDIPPYKIQKVGH
ncbi:hypothetical protein WTH01_18110 [Weissella thailandensis]|nr:hypothetical protein WTH01_18110 [Weissella thailandensis]